ncbi:hypothetical protein GCM10011581_44480 [Saccharopolyspora subtropica]|uniref:DUF5134 domain-containing protein n=1 Tax=Saccharopolyspora thermophila TaxID=89367 RepID=A0A917K6D6_9PSEU|nr:DUF5134 domain-containing protein [Saccharopolyspora subtropica]GGJ02422.1 hypothetical protein GCM10011581_44480 [Saccharopolyspora subtropica]
MGWIDQVLTAAVVAVTTACLTRLVRCRRAGRQPGGSDVAHVLMGVGMVAMFLPPVLPAAAWAALFTAYAVWSAALAWRRRTGWSALHHVIGALAMAYMFAAARPHEPTTHLVSLSAGHGHGSAVTLGPATPAGFAFPLIAWVLAVYCALSAGFAGTDLLRARPALTATTELVLSLSMGYMFLAML